MRAVILLLLSVCLCLPAQELRVVCTIPDLADMVTEIGGDRVKVSFLARARDNPHYLSARPSYIRQVASADAFVLAGLDLEVGWAPALLKSARNRRVMPGKPGYIDCSKAVQALGIPAGKIDRSMGDVHPHGNPHYTLSPLHGIQVALYLGEQLAALDAGHADAYRKQANALAHSIAEALYGEDLVKAHGLSQLVSWHVAGSLRQHVQINQLGGWLADLQSLHGTHFIGDHMQWPYLAHCFGFTMEAHLEPKAGVPPTNGHVKKLVDLASTKNIKGVLTAPWFDPRHVQTLATAGKLPVLDLSHQLGARTDGSSYLAMHAYNVKMLAKLIE